jgi:hypothetical protein
MNCTDARGIILGADHGALRDRTDPVLRRHLESCDECAAMVSHVVADVSRLRAALIARGARAVARPRRSTTKRVAMTLVPVALAAELAAFAFMGSRDSYNPITDRRIIDDSVVSLLPVAHTKIDTGEVVAATARKSRVAPIHAVSPKHAATELDSTKQDKVLSEFVSAEEMGQLQVVPTGRDQHVAVIGTSNPKITVVWISRDSL